MDKQEALRHYFGHSAFRPGQERLIDAVLDGRDVLGVMPTGGGKSLCYQVPALLLPGVTLVVSPLISLMKDQVAALQAAGAPAACLNSALSLEQLRTVYSRARQGAYKLLYVAPERLEGEGFDRLVRELEVPLVAVDEAHCISQWGQDFRPSYLRISAFLEGLPRRPAVAAFTATATGPVQQDIVQLLALRDPVREVTGFDRPNLFFDVQHPRSKLAALLKLVEERPGRSGIVYCATRSGVEKVCQALEARGVSATRYHAGLEPEERQRNQDDFQFDRKAVMVATNAFGMGIDKSNVSYVVHYNMPKSLEAYYQEAGRAGRDGEAADCILLYSAGDIATARFLIENGGNEELTPEAREAVRRHDYQRLSAMTGYCRTTACLRGRILDYFGQSHDASCGSCGNCRGEFASEDITVSAQMILSCVVRVREKLGYYVGKTLIVQVLRGSRDQRVRDLGLDKLSTFGLMAQLSAGRVRELMEYLELEGFLRTNPAHSTLEPAGKARSLLFAGERLSMPLRKDRVREKRAASQGTALSEAGEERLLAALRTLRARLAQAEGVPAYIVFSNAALASMARRAPRTMEAFLEVSGVGRVKAAKYGEAFLRVIQECSAN
ncbi:DNA helicase RecQ [Oscillospiraceae bacterium 44-5]